jgi:hypothetical protein
MDQHPPDTSPVKPPIWDRLQSIDRRVLYTLIFISVIIPVLEPLRLPMPVAPDTQEFYDAVEAIPSGSVVLFPFDIWPSTLAETQPMAVAALRHCFRKNLRVIGLSNIGIGGPSIAERLLDSIGTEFGKVYGKDYVNLGYKAGYQAVLLGMGHSIKDIFPTDFRGTRLEDIPLMQHVPNYDSVNFVLIIADNAMVDYWVALVNARYGLPMVAGVTAVMAPKMLSYVQARQLLGLLGGMKGAAEYETLIGRVDKASAGMDAQSLIHLLIILFIVLGNTGFIAQRFQHKRAGGKG